MKMKKMIAGILCVSLSPVAAFAQTGWHGSVKAGVNFANVHHADGKTLVAPTAGVEGEYRFGKLFGLSAGLNYSRQGCRNEYAIATVSVDGPCSILKIKKDVYDYLNVPVMANFHAGNFVSFHAGIEPGFKLSARTKGSRETDGHKQEYSTSASACNATLSLPVGVTAEYKNVSLSLDYHHGLVNIQDDMDGGSCNQKHRWVSLTVGYRLF